MRHAKTKQTAIWMFLSIAVVIGVLLAPAIRAVELDSILPADGDVDSMVMFELHADIEPVEFIPISFVTLVISGPGGDQECVFEIDGTPISGCEGLVVHDFIKSGPFAFENLVGAGWNGAADENTFFGPGYGYGYGPGNTMELKWKVWWDTAGKSAGDYDVSFKIHSEGDLAERDFVQRNPRTITLKLSEVSAVMTIKEPFPINDDYVFECEAQGFTGWDYDWDFGDGDILIDIENDNVFHTYTEPGHYVASCTVWGHDDQGNPRVATGWVPVWVEGPENEATVTVKEYFPQGLDYVFECNVDGFAPTTYDWFFGDGEAQFSSNNQNVWHTYQASGDYTVTCVASDGVNTETAILDVSASE